LSKPIRVAVIGAGAFGKNHARVYSELHRETQAGTLPKGAPAIELAGIVDTDAARAAQIAGDFHTRAYSSIRELLAQGGADAVSIAVPTKFHRAVAGEALEAGFDVLIEKPLAATLDQADEIIDLAAEHGRVAQVGHLERFNPAVRATIPLITKPMFFEVHRLSLFGPRALDVDVVLDLMIHDIDIILSFVAGEVAEVRAVGLPILSQKVDIASVRLQFANGCIANLTASRVSTERVRKVRFFQPSQYVSIDYARQDVLVFTVNKTVGTAPAEGGLPQMPDVMPSKPPVIPEEPLRAEILSFLHAVQTRETPVVSLEDGRRALAVALEIQKAIEEHAERANLGALTK
jgi:predicted dehydrogenase